MFPNNNKSPYGITSYDFLIKLLIIGDSDVGKREILLRYSNDSFVPRFISEFGIDFKIKQIDLDGLRIRQQIWDTAGQERFRTITRAYYRGAQGIMLLYDVTNEQSFQNIRNWIRNIEMHAPEGVRLILVGNRCHLNNERMVGTERGQALADEYGIDFYEVSATQNTNIEAAFTVLTARVIQNDPNIVGALERIKAEIIAKRKKVKLEKRKEQLRPEHRFNQIRDSLSALNIPPVLTQLIAVYDAENPESFVKSDFINSVLACQQLFVERRDTFSLTRLLKQLEKNSECFPEKLHKYRAMANIYSARIAAETLPFQKNLLGIIDDYLTPNNKQINVNWTDMVRLRQLELAAETGDLISINIFVRHCGELLERGNVHEGVEQDYLYQLRTHWHEYALGYMALGRLNKLRGDHDALATIENSIREHSLQVSQGLGSFFKRPSINPNLSKAIDTLIAKLNMGAEHPVDVTLAYCRSDDKNPLKPGSCAWKLFAILLGKDPKGTFDPLSLKRFLTILEDGSKKLSPAKTAHQENHKDLLNQLVAFRFIEAPSSSSSSSSENFLGTDYRISKDISGFLKHQTRENIQIVHSLVRAYVKHPETRCNNSSEQAQKLLRQLNHAINPKKSEQNVLRIRSAFFSSADARQSSDMEEHSLVNTKAIAKPR